MAERGRLNGVIRALEAGQPAFTSFATADVATALAFAATRYDGIVFEMEHNPWDAAALRDALQYMLDRAQIAGSASVAPAVTPMVRIPPNGGELGQWHAKQALDLGAYGIVWPHVSTVDQARNAVAACRYPRLPSADRYEPAGLRGDGPRAAARYWGLGQQDYYRKADVWPLDPKGEILVVLMIEDMAGVENLDAMLAGVPGIGAVLIGEGDLSQELGVPRQYDHPSVRDAMTEVVSVCKARGVPAGHPHVDAGNVARVLAEGYRFLMAAPGLDYSGLDTGLEAAGRTR